jgi:hypothetical protein
VVIGYVYGVVLMDKYYHIQHWRYHPVRDHSLVACLQESNPKAEIRAQLHHTRFFSCQRRLYGLNTNADLIYDASNTRKSNLYYIVWTKYRSHPIRDKNDKKGI